jgi:ribosome biogenesis protein Nip4
MRELKDFLEAIGAAYGPAGMRVNFNDRRFVVGPEVAAQIRDRGRLVYAGRLLGRTRGEFVPSAGLLRELGRMVGPHKAWVDEKVGWLFACGRDVFAESILSAEGELAEGACFLVMLGGDCLGYGRVETAEGRTILKNLFDLGDFLRRERGIEDASS